MERFRAVGKIAGSSRLFQDDETGSTSAQSTMESRAAARRAETNAQLAEVERVLEIERRENGKKTRSRRKKMEHTLKFNKQRVSAL